MTLKNSSFYRMIKKSITNGKRMICLSYPGMTRLRKNISSLAMKNTIIRIFQLSFTFITFIPISQAQEKDTEMWLGGSLDSKFSKKLNGQISQVFKFNDTISRYKSSFTELGLKYDLNKFIDFKINYRFIGNPPDGNTHRFSADFASIIKKKNFPLSFAYRMRYQHEILINNRNTTDFIRNKFTLKYNLSKIVDPFVSFEMFYRLNGKNEIREFRYLIGADWKLSDKLELSSYYFYSDELNMRNTKDVHTICFMLSYSLDSKKEKQKSSLK